MFPHFDKKPDSILVINGKNVPCWKVDSAVLQVWLGGSKRVDEMMQAGEITVLRDSKTATLKSTARENPQTGKEGK